MQRDLETRYAPVLEPDDPASLPLTHRRTDAAYVPLGPRQARRPARRGSWIRRLSQSRPLWGHYCVSDWTLRRFERVDPLGLRAAMALGLQGVVTMDVPLYGFMTAAQRERAHMLRLDRLYRTVDAGERLGLGVIPLVKALDASGLQHELDLCHELGLPRAALYVREFLLEGDRRIPRRFARGAHRLGIRPLLLGAFSPAAAQWGPADLAARHHYILARRGHVLGMPPAPGPRRSGVYSPLVRRFLVPGDVASLCSHNFEWARRRLEVRHARVGIGG